MNQKKTPINGFSKLNKQQKIDWIVDEFLNSNPKEKQIITQYWNNDFNIQNIHDEFAENTISNFYLPFGIAPNFLINNDLYTIPMVIEESSVIAAASKSAKFWLDKGGFKTKVISTEKLGHTHFIFKINDFNKFNDFFNNILKSKLLKDTESITYNMKNRGGGILNIELINKNQELENYFQLKASFNTVDSMGANFINSCLEQFSKTLKSEIESSDLFDSEEKNSLQIIMNILSNYTPNCLVRAEVSCRIDDLNDDSGINPQEFADKFYQAVKIAEIEPFRAATHNKGIMNGIDSVVIATGNDFRAVESCVHVFASKTGKYTSLTHCDISNGTFKFWIDLPISLGVIGGLTTLHPLVKTSLKILKNPNAEKLMEICAVSGLAQNFAAIRSLVTTGIQKGHMKMHLLNILNGLGATQEEKNYFTIFFKDKTVSHHNVVDEFNRLRKIK